MSRLLRALALFLFGASSLAHATDGVLEISQVCAVSTGCFVGDAAGFPVTIAATGSYRLTSNLVVGDASLDGISTHDPGPPVVWTDDVQIDLNGFAIIGPGTCMGLGSSVNCLPGGSGDGIDAAGSSRVSVRNGNVRGFGKNGVATGGRARIGHVVAEANGSVGISSGNASTIAGNTLYQNAAAGISTGDGSSISGNNVQGNGSQGILASDGSTLTGNVLRENTFGITSGIGGTIADNSVSLNEGDGIDAGSGSTVAHNTISENGGDGIVASSGTTVADNTIFINGSNGVAVLGDEAIVVRNNVALNGTGDSGGYGLSFSGSSTYKDNVITNNITGPVTGTGINLGENYCDGTGVLLPSCP